MNIYLLAVIIISLVVFAGYAFYNAVITKQQKNKYLTEKKGWHFLFIYYNPQDPRTVVSKQSGAGITFNFAKPFPKLFILLIVVLYILHEFSLY
jgi:uncharacterized membrane protein